MTTTLTPAAVQAALLDLAPFVAVTIEPGKVADGPCEVAEDDTCGVGQVCLLYSRSNEVLGHVVRACLACAVPHLQDALRDPATDWCDVYIAARTVDLAAVTA